MQLSKVLFSACLLILFTECKKKQEDPIKEPEQQQELIQNRDTVFAFYSINPLLKPYYNFTDDSYWIYSDSVANYTDSLFLQNFKLTTDTVKLLSKTTMTLALYETCKYNLRSLKTVDNTLSIVVRSNTVGVYTAYMNSHYAPYQPPILYTPDVSTCENEVYDYSYGGIRNCRVIKDTLKLKNGKTFSQVSFFLHQDPGAYVVEYRIPSPPLYSKSNWVANIGMVQFEAPNYRRINHQLLRYQVKLR